MVSDSKVLEVGVGAGKNMPFYPSDVEVIAIDLSLEMLEKARMRSQMLDLGVDLQVGDAQKLQFPNSTSNTVVATWVFCSVPDSHLVLADRLPESTLRR